MSDKELIAEAEKLVGEAKADGMSSVAYSVIKRLIAALEAATSERDAVPDAATEALNAQLENAKAGWESALRIVNEGDEIIKLIGAERDAAFAAIERVRKYADERSVYAKTRNNVVGSWRIASDLYDLLGVSHEEQVALDGAPEPEWEERLAACEQHGTHCWSCARHKERRRPAGEWHRLPVEGESK